MPAEKKMRRYALGGVALLCLFLLLAWFASRKDPAVPEISTTPGPTAPTHEPVAEPATDSATDTVTNPPNDVPAITNAADLYRQAFALYAALTNDHSTVLVLADWRTNVDAATEAELCEKIRPICDLMHQAAAVTNCDWGVESITSETVLRYFNSARGIGRTAIWSAAHCRSSDVATATDDLQSVLRLGQRFSGTSILGCLVDLNLQNSTWTYLTQNIGLFTGGESQRLVAAFSDPVYEEAPGRAMEQEAILAEHPSLNQSITPEVQATFQQADVLAMLKQVADSERELAKALASGSETEYETWLQHWNELKQSNLVSKGLGSTFLEQFVDKMRAGEVARAEVVAGLAVAQGGGDTLQSHLDPSSGKPFTYVATPDGFELQSTFQRNGIPLTMQFK
jgi:hypothetical protein